MIDLLIFLITNDSYSVLIKSDNLSLSAYILPVVIAILILHLDNKYYKSLHLVNDLHFF